VPTDSKTRVAIYTRVSQDRDGTGTSVAQQLADCRKYAADQGFQIVAELSDNDISAYTGKRRPSYEKLIELISGGEVDAVIVWEQSRLTRMPYELEGYINACQPHRVSTYTVTGGLFDLTTDQGRMVARMTGAVNRYEVDQLRGRVKRGMRARAAKGLPGGGRTPFGFKADKLTHEPEEAAAILAGTTAIVTGESLYSVVQAWREKGLVTSFGKVWQPDTVRQVLLRARNAGLREFKGKIIGSAAWEPIVPVELWTSCKEVLTDASRRKGPGPSPAHFGSYIFKCGAVIDGVECGAPMRVATVGAVPAKGNRAARPSRYVYTCTARGRGGRHVLAPRDGVDSYVTDQILRGIHDLGYGLPSDEPVAALPVVDNSKTLAELDERESVISNQFLLGRLSGPAYEEALVIITALREQARQVAAAPIRQATDELFDLAHERKRWEDLSLTRRRALLAEIAEVTILPVGPVYRADVTKRVRVRLNLAAWATDVDETVAASNAVRDAWERDNPMLPDESLLDCMSRGPQ
jgi:site-specific DNA recombinase